MMKAITVHNKSGRLIAVMMWLIFHGMILSLLIAMIQVNVPLEGFVFPILLAVFWSIIANMILRSCPSVELTAEGITVRVLIKKQFYKWTDIKQAGILYRFGRGIWYNQMVLLKGNGSCRRYQDKTFLLRNIGRVIPMEATPKIREFVISCYGPLDFDLSDGKEET